MGEIGPSEMRISDTEREAAVRMLGEHMSVGRLNVDEYGERSAKATAAKTQGELTSLFVDLPEPRPVFTPARPPVRAATAPAPARQQERPLSQRLWGAAVPLSAIIALVLFLTLIKVWFIFLLPAAVAVIGRAIWGEDQREQQRRAHRRMHRGWHD